MSVKSGASLAEACVPGALAGGLVRASFFDGMFLTQADLEAEQRYWRLKRRLTNRALGKGVVWGLKLAYDPEARRFRLSPGYGLDCCGNDLVVPAAVELRESEVLRDAKLLMDLEQAKPELIQRGGRGGFPACLMLEYVECPQDPRPIHVDACTPDPRCCEPSRVRETSRLLLVPAPAPPKPGPVESFVGELETWKSSLGNKLGELFPAALPQPADAASSVLPMAVHVRLGLQELAIPVPTQVNVPTPAPAPIAVDVPRVPGNVRLDFELRPDPGWAFYAGEARAGQPGGAPVVVTGLQAPFDLHFAWARGFDLAAPPIPPEGTTRDGAFEVDVGFTALFSHERMRARLRLTYLVGFRPTVVGDVVLVHVELRNLQVRLVSLAADPSPAGLFPDCNVCPPDAAPMASAGEQAGAIALAALYAWLVGSLGNLKVDPTVYDGHRLAATWIYLAAWRLVFGANPAGSNDAQLRLKFAALLQKLLHAWCNGFIYPGPSCGDGPHGIYLGCVQLNAAGLVTAFDPWCERQYVLLGPLVSHWGAQLGAPRVDVLVGRLVRWICCVAEVRPTDPAALPALPPGEAALLRSAWNDNNPTNVSNLLGNNPPALGTLASDGWLAAFGDPNQTEARLAALGTPVLRSEELSLTKFLPRVLGVLAQALPGGSPTAWVRYSLKGQSGQQAHLFAAADAGETARADERRRGVTALVAARPAIAKLPTIARPPAIDLLVELTRLLPLEVGDGAIKDQLRDAGVLTWSDLLGPGPEAIAARLGLKTEAEELALSNAFDATTKALGSLVDALAAVMATSKPFTRRVLGQESFRKEARTAVTKNAPIDALAEPQATALVATAAERALARGVK